MGRIFHCGTRVSVSNFRSFGEEVTLDMIASTKLTDHTDHLIQIDKTDKHVVRTAMLYGPNAAGKSHLIKAMDYVQTLICTGSQSHHAGPEPFRFDRSTASKPSSFEFRFMVGDEIFTYGFDVGRRGIVGEWLSALRGSREKDIFVRDEKGQTLVVPIHCQKKALVQRCADVATQMVLPAQELDRFLADGGYQRCPMVHPGRIPDIHPQILPKSLKSKGKESKPTRQQQHIIEHRSHAKKIPGVRGWPLTAQHHLRKEFQNVFEIGY